MMLSMCQYNVQCPVGRHRPGTQCPYVGRGPSRGGGNGSGSAWAAAATIPKPHSTEPPRYRRAVASSGVSGLDLLIVIVIAVSWDRFYEETGIAGVIFTALAVLLPFVIAAWLTSTCTAWNESNDGRCQRRRIGWRRCELQRHGRASQFVTFPEVAAVLSILVGIANAIILINSAL